MTKNTRYDVGDFVSLSNPTHFSHKSVWQVQEVDDPSTSSPTYFIEKVETVNGNFTSGPEITVRASEIVKASSISREKIKSKARIALQEIANRKAAKMQSEIMEDEERNGVDLMVAEYGSKVYVNGEEFNGTPNLERYRKLRDLSTDEFVYDESVSVGEIIEKVSMDADVPNVIVKDVVEDMYVDDINYHKTQYVEKEVSGSIGRYKKKEST